MDGSSWILISSQRKMSPHWRSDRERESELGVAVLNLEARAGIERSECGFCKAVPCHLATPPWSSTVLRLKIFSRQSADVPQIFADFASFVTMRRGFRAVAPALNCLVG